MDTHNKHRETWFTLAYKHGTYPAQKQRVPVWLGFYLSDTKARTVTYISKSINESSYLRCWTLANYLNNYTSNYPSLQSLCPPPKRRSIPYIVHYIRKRVPIRTQPLSLSLWSPVLQLPLQTEAWHSQIIGWSPCCCCVWWKDMWEPIQVG